MCFLLPEQRTDALVREIPVPLVNVDPDGVVAVAGGYGDGCAGAGERVQHDSRAPGVMSAVGPAEGVVLGYGASLEIGRSLGLSSLVLRPVGRASCVELVGCDDPPAGFPARPAHLRGRHRLYERFHQRGRVYGVVGTVVSAGG